ncbi:hypothetical protein ElyMa_004271400 [Elysia marginata]|uniref:Uncharacterized protein n=1 Tax=Elysia marginata TaxID=1093978 RepID=A0AAV4GVQ6_9GAST|nr:hypothetical protein ElyMa_004271400 [Elysia marginata]
MIIIEEAVVVVATAAVVVVVAAAVVEVVVVVVVVVVVRIFTLYTLNFFKEINEELSYQNAKLMPSEKQRRCQKINPDKDPVWRHTYLQN